MHVHDEALPAGSPLDQNLAEGVLGVQLGSDVGDTFVLVLEDLLPVEPDLLAADLVGLACVEVGLGFLAAALPLPV